MDKNVQGINQLSTADLLKSKNDVAKTEGSDFGEILKETIGEVNELQEKGQEAMADLATGQVKDLHQAAIAIDKAELSMKMMLEVRNKAINAYKEILRTQI
jgi:flagellar hook-basal body complex protein FliE